jgi:hypothetical protein
MHGNKEMILRRPAVLPLPSFRQLRGKCFRLRETFRDCENRSKIAVFAKIVQAGGSNHHISSRSVRFRAGGAICMENLPIGKNRLANLGICADITDREEN